MAMESNASPLANSALPEAVRHRFAEAADVDSAIVRIVAGPAWSWPQIARVSNGEVVLGRDNLFRVAMWSASTWATTLMGARRATLLLVRDGDAWEIRCAVVAHACLATRRPLSGFLLKPIEILDERTARRGPANRDGNRSPDDIPDRAGEIRPALFDAFPVDDGENAAPGEAPFT